MSKSNENLSSVNRLQMKENPLCSHVRCWRITRIEELLAVKTHLETRIKLGTNHHEELDYITDHVTLTLVKEKLQVLGMLSCTC
jgi:hypothetical protein